MDETSKKKIVEITYTNWRGETAVRRIEPLEVWFGSTEWHKDEQWLLKAIDLEKGVERDFALKDISTWKDGGNGRA